MADIGVRVNVSGADEGQRKLEDVAKSIGKIEEGGLEASTALRGFAAVAGGVLVTAAGYAATKLYEAFEETRRLGDEMNNLSQRTGIAVEKLSGGLRLAAETSGSSIEGLAQGMNQLNRAISEAADGTGKQAEAFKRLGISVTDAGGKLKSADQVLEEIARAFAGAEDGAVKAEIAMTLLGRAGVNLIPLLNQGAEGLNKLEREAKLAGITMDKETAEAASKLNENLRVLQAYGQGFWQQTAAPMVEGLAKITTAMRNARLEGEGWLASMGAGVGKALNMMGFNTPGMTKEDERDNYTLQIQNRLKLIAAQRAQPGGGDDGMIASLEAQVRMFESKRDALSNIIGSGMRPDTYSDVQGGKVDLPLAPPKPDKPDRPSRVSSRELTSAQIATMQARSLEEFNKNVERDNALIQQNEDKHRLSWEQMEKNKKDIDDRMYKAQVAMAEGTFALDEDLHTKTAALDEKAQIKRKDDMRRMKAVFEGTAFDVINMYEGMQSGIQSSIYGLLSGTQSLGEGVKGFFKSITNSILQEFSKIASHSVMRLLFGGDSSTGGGFLSGPGSLFSGSGSSAGGSGGIGGALRNIGSSISSFFGLGGTSMASVNAGAAGAMGGVGGAAGGFGGMMSGFAGPAAAVVAGMMLVNMLDGGGGPSIIDRWDAGERGAAVLNFTSRSQVMDYVMEQGYASDRGVIPFATGGDTIVSSPMMFMAGEAGAERVTVSPLSGAARHGMGGGGSTVIVQGLSLMDNFAARRLAYELKRVGR